MTSRLEGCGVPFGRSEHFLSIPACMARYREIIIGRVCINCPQEIRKARQPEKVIGSVAMRVGRPAPPPSFDPSPRVLEAIDRQREQIAILRSGESPVTPDESA